MPDLADRISRAAVAALDLAPFDDRFGRLSRQVLAGGATRFQRVTADDQTVHFVIPVGLAGDRIDYGALVLQDRQAGILWRDALGLDHSVVVPREGSTATFSPLELGGEGWLRFDVEGSGERMVFLVPPVNDQLLRSTLVDFFQAVPGSPTAVPGPDLLPEPQAPAVRFPDPEPEPEPTEATAVLPELPADPMLEPMHTTPGAPLAPEEKFALTDAEVDQWDPGHHEQAHEAPFQLYRDEASPGWGTAATQPLPTQSPAYATAQPATPWPPQQEPGPARVPAQPTGSVAAPVAAQPSGTSRTLVGFLLGLFATLAIGGGIIIARLLGVL